MSQLQSRKALPWILGIATLAISLAVATQLLQSAETQPPGKATNTAALAPISGITVKGIVDTPEGILRIDAPAVPVPTLTVKEVLVREGAHVKLGTPLIQFDDLPFREKVKQAEASVEEAKWLAAIAKAQSDDHPKKLVQQERALRVARTELGIAEDGYKRASEIFDKYLSTEKIFKNEMDRELLPAEKDIRRRENLDLLKLEGNIKLLKEKVEKEELELVRLKSYSPQFELGRAQSNVALRESLKRDAENLVEACLLTAKTEGIVEQVSANVGMTFGPGTRAPALLIVPSGSRVVRAEVEAEFAFKIADQLGKDVIVYDDHNFDITYPGVVERISLALLPRRGLFDALSVGPSHKVLEVLVRVKDPTPAGKPPLLPGLPVRVGFGQ